MIARIIFPAAHPAIPFLLLLAIADDAMQSARNASQRYAEQRPVEESAQSVAIVRVVPRRG